jgi:cysteine desulfurase
MKKIVYLDNAATTKPKKEVVEAITKSLVENYGNASSIHDLGDKARKVLNEFRKK